MSITPDVQINLAKGKMIADMYSDHLPTKVHFTLLPTKMDLLWAVENSSLGKLRDVKKPILRAQIHMEATK